MKIHKIIYLLCLLSVFCSVAVRAESRRFAQQDSPFTDHYGVVNAVYSEESRLVISDVSVQYNNRSSFFNSSGGRLNGVGSLKQGVFVKYHYYKKPSVLILKDLTIISKQEFEESENLGTELY